MQHLSRALVLSCVAFLALPAAQAQQGTNGPRTDQPSGESSAVKPGAGTSGLGEVGRSRTEDIRRTSTGKLQLSNEQRRKLKEAVGKARLAHQDHVAFTIAVGASVPQQADARDLPTDVRQAVPLNDKLQYVFVKDRLVLIDKDTRRIVAIVPGMA